MRKRGKGGAKIEKYLGVKVFLFGFCNHASEMVKSHQKPPMSPLPPQTSFSMYELTWYLTYFWYIVCFCFKKELCTSWHDMAQLMGFYLLCPSVVRTEGASCNISHQMMMNNENNYISTSNISQMHMKDNEEDGRIRSWAWIAQKHFVSNLMKLRMKFLMKV